jgi:ABC-type multidrug transport system ATPase subunit
VLSTEDALSKVGLIKAADKQIRYYSSGMKQRLKLAQAFFSDTPVLLLDEPTTNLDAEGIELYQQLIKQYQAERLLIVSSNDPEEYGFCGEMIRMESFK